MSIDTEQLARRILWACIEDYAGLWELLWEANTEFPNECAADRELATQRLVRSFHNKGLVTLYRCQEPYGELTQIGPDQVSGLLEDRRNWEAPDIRGLSIRASATKAGEAAYRNRQPLSD